MVYEIQIRHGSLAEWTAANPVLLAGELVAEIDPVTLFTKFKVGNGTWVYLDLPYAPAGAGVWGSVGGTLANQTDLVNALLAKQDAGNELAALQALSDVAGFVKKVSNGVYAIDTTVYGTGGGTTLTIETKTATATITLPNDKLILCDATTGPIVINLPTAVGIEGTTVGIKKMDVSVNTVTAVPNGTQTIDGYTSMIIEWQWTTIFFTSDGTNWVMR